MYDDIINPQIRDFSWDFDKYEKNPYCPFCGSEALTIISEQLLKDKLEKDIRCDICQTEWHEEWDKNIKLKLVVICGFHGWVTSVGSVK
jgi:transcription elongation factor Elf1